MNEKEITVSENNIHFKQTEWATLPINHLSRYLLQYSGSIDDMERLLKEQMIYPARLLFVSSKKSASIFEFANKEMASIDMKNGYLAMANHACVIQNTFNQFNPSLESPLQEKYQKIESMVIALEDELKKPIPICTTLVIDNLIVHKLSDPEGFQKIPEIRYLPSSCLERLRMGQEIQ